MNIGDRELEEIQDKLMGVDTGGNSGGNKAVKKGKKTIRQIKKLQKENADRQRKNDSENNLRKDFTHFPFNKFSEEKIPEVIDIYSAWVEKSLKEKFPYFSNLDNDILCKQTRSSGPGGQNVNKTSTSVTAIHLLSGIYSRSSENREVPLNKKDATTKLIQLLENHIKNWGTYLFDVDLSQRKDVINKFVKSLKDIS